MRHSNVNCPGWLRAATISISGILGLLPGVLKGVEKPPAGPPPAAGIPAIPFTDPVDFFQQFLRGETAEDRRRLEQVPVSLAEESQLGSQMLQNFLAELRRERIRVLRDGRDVQYLQRLVTLLQPQMRRADRYRRIEVLVADGPQTDARSFPGGHLVFFRGILELAPNEAAIVGVVGHELSHLDHGHQVGHLRRMRLAQQSFTAAGSAQDPQKMLQAGTQLMRSFSRPFHPEEEAEADHDATTWTFHAGYDPRELGELILRLRRDERLPGQLPFAFLRTHPPHEDRHRAVREQYQQLRQQFPQIPLYLGKQNLEQRITRDEQRWE